MNFKSSDIDSITSLKDQETKLFHTILLGKEMIGF